MPTNKGRRIASKQARAGQKRKRGKGPSGVPVDSDQRSNTSIGEPEVHQRLGVTPSPSVVADNLATPAVHSTPPHRRPTIYRYVNAEIKRIVGFSSLIVALLLTLSFVFN